jgi:HTH-type transcriptional regulator, transcriptional repressor of NAD biosynthesis genes
MLGVTVGKFLPLHRGHLHLLRTAQAQVTDLVIVVADHPDQPIRGEVRARWIRSELPEAEVIVTPDDVEEAPRPWAVRTLQLLGGRRPDIAFTSEPYGDDWAEAMGCVHRSVDPDRTVEPASGRQIRADLAGNWELLSSAAKASLARRVVITGAESTGKTTLAEELAKQLGTVWVPEFGRAYWEGRRHLVDPGWDADEFAAIAHGQAALEDALARKAKLVVVCDTDASTTGVWQRRYLGVSSPEVVQLAAGRTPDLTLICAPDLPWTQDGTRESEHERAMMHDWCLEAVADGRPHRIIRGSGPERIESAMAAVAPLRKFEPLRDATREPGAAAPDGDWTPEPRAGVEHLSHPVNEGPPRQRYRQMP